MKIWLVQIVVCILTISLFLILNAKIDNVLSEDDISKEKANLETLLQSNNVAAEELKILINNTNQAANSINSVQQKLKTSVNYITFDSGTIVIDSQSNSDFISDGSCNKKRGLFGQKVRFNTTFKSPPKVLLSIGSFDIRNEKDARLKTDVLEIENEGFTFNAYTWCDTSISYLKLNWLAAGV